MPHHPVDVTELVENTDIPNHLNSMVTALLREQQGNKEDLVCYVALPCSSVAHESTDQRHCFSSTLLQGPCMEYLLRLHLLKRAVNLGSNDVSIFVVVLCCS